MLIRLLETLKEAAPKPEDMPWAPRAYPPGYKREHDRNFQPPSPTSNDYGRLEDMIAQEKRKAGVFGKPRDVDFRPTPEFRDYEGGAMDIDVWNKLYREMQHEASLAADPPADGDYDKLAMEYATEHAMSLGYCLVVDDIQKNSPKVLFKFPNWPPQPEEDHFQKYHQKLEREKAGVSEGKKKLQKQG